MHAANLDPTQLSSSSHLRILSIKVRRRKKLLLIERYSAPKGLRGKKEMLYWVSVEVYEVPRRALLWSTNGMGASSTESGLT